MTLDVRDSPAPATTASGPTVRSTWRSARGPLAVVLALVLVGTLVGVLSASGPSGRLDPAAPTPAGAKAVAEVLRDRGVEVTRVDTVEAVEAADSRQVTVVVPLPSALAPSELRRLGRLDAGLLVVGADDEQLDQLDLPAEVQDEVPVEQRQPACELPVAVEAGDADLGGRTYRGTDEAAAVGCYAVRGEASLLRLPASSAVLLGDGAPLTNERLDERGNAALALGLLSERPRVLWLVPRPGRVVEDDIALRDLLPAGLPLAALQLLIAAGVLALWRARRLGRVVTEPLPVVVRAAEAVEGRSRLYRAARARGSAAEALQSAARERLGRRVGAPSSADRAADRSALVSLVAERTGDPPQLVDALLYGGPPADDAALVRLADDLHALETTLSRT